MFLKNKKRKSKVSLLRTMWSMFSLGSDAKKGIWMILLLVIAIITCLGFFHKAGVYGDLLDNYFSYFFGWGKWSIPIVILLTIIFQTTERNKKFDGSNIIGLFLFLFSFSGLLYFWELETSGGYVGLLSAPWLINNIGTWSTSAIYSSSIIISLLLLFDISLSRLLGPESIIFKIVFIILRIIFSPFIRKEYDDDERRKEKRIIEDDDEDEETEDKKSIVKEYDIEEEDETEEEEAKQVIADDEEDNSKNKKDFFWSPSNLNINFPFSLLKNKPKRPISGNIERNKNIIKQTLLDFGIPISLGDVRVGPTVTQYTFKPANGIPVARVKTLSDDLALNLALHPVRIEAPIPGKALMGLEVPNQTKVLVTLKEVLQSKKFKERKSNTMIALGRDVSGQIWMDDITKMPHLLVAGATNSGKSICLHSIITSLLYQNNPDDLKFILIDAKQVELTVYNDLPYLVAPVITDNKRAVRALQWCLNEMDRRLETLKEAGCQNIQDFNKKKRFNRMPYLVIVVDELGDLLSTSRKEAESAIIRLGQKARAAGIHLVLATQRPSVDILSGLIKANMPSRIAFQVTSGVNSKTILDFLGAEKLLGQGDMLFVSPQLAKPIRIQGAYVSKEEVKSVVKYAKTKAGKANYIVDEALDNQQTQMDSEAEYIGDDMLEEAKRMIMEAGKASATMLQSRLAIGYPRANRILDVLEKQGVVGPSVQNKPREVLKNI